jgi:small-conductance mechanosensitive channel
MARRRCTVLFVAGNLILIAVYMFLIYNALRNGMDVLPFALLVTVLTFLLLFFLAVLWALCDFIDGEGGRCEWRHYVCGDC